MIRLYETQFRVGTGVLGNDLASTVRYIQQTSSNSYNVSETPIMP